MDIMSLVGSAGGGSLASLGAGVGGSIVGAVVLMIVGYWAMRLTGMIDSQTKVFHLEDIWKFVKNVPVYLLAPLLRRVRRLPVVGRVWSKVVDRLEISRVDEMLDSKFRNAKYADRPELYGDMKQIAEKLYPPQRFSLLWERVASDIERPLIRDGRTPNLEHLAPALVDNFVDRTFVQQAIHRGAATGLAAMGLAFVLWNPFVYFGPGAGQFEQIVQQRMSEQRSTPSRDIWTDADRQAMADSQKRSAQISAAGTVVWNFVTAPHGLLTVLLFGVAIGFGRTMLSVREEVDQKIEPFAHLYKDSIVRFAKRIHKLPEEVKAYEDSHKITKLDKSTLYKLGTATGRFHKLGYYAAPLPGRPIMASETDLCQSVIIFGKTGVGKTEKMLKVIFRALCAARAKHKAKGNAKALSIYVTDVKAILWKDLLPVAIEFGHGDDVRIIGAKVGEEYGVALIEGMTPELVATTINSTMNQLKGSAGGGDKFWQDEASDKVFHSAKIVYAFELTPEGYAFAQRTGERPYSLATIAKFALDGGDYAFADSVVRAIYAAVMNGTGLPGFADRVDNSLFESITHMTGAWREMAVQTQSGLKANINNALSKLLRNDDLRTQFASGGAPKLMSMAEAYQAITMININSMKYGNAGTMINIFLKTLLYAEAMRRQDLDEDIGKKEKMVGMFDEMQEMITVGGELDEGSFPAISRSTGFVYCSATQTVSGLINKIGEHATTTFLNQCGTKAFMRVDDEATLKLAVSLAPTVMRSEVYRSDMYESYEMMCAQTGRDIFNYEVNRPRLPAPTEEDVIRDLISSLWLMKHAAVPIEYKTNVETIEEDHRFLPTPGSVVDLSGNGSNAGEFNAYMGALGQAAHRAEDKRETLLTQGNSEEKALSEDDFHDLGNDYMFLFAQRAGSVRRDIVRLG